MVIQVLPSISKHDAISQHVLRLDDEFRKLGKESTIVADHIDPSLVDRVKPSNLVDSFDDYHVIYHMSIASRLAERVGQSSANLDIWYHNITPASYFEPWEPYVALELRIARHQLNQLAIRAQRGVAASQYSLNELELAGCRHSRVMPVLFDVSSKVTQGSTKHRDQKTKILSVGRFAPHKKIENLVKVLALYRELFGDDIELNLVGTSASEPYFESIMSLIKNLKLDEYVIFHNDIDDDLLADLYATSDVYLCVSEHEGFCVPLLEAQYAELPIVTSRHAAIAETVGDAGIVLEKDADIIEFVSAINLLKNDETVRNMLKKNAKTRQKLIDVNAEAQKSVEWFLEGS